ncbi:Hypothetical predicted protein [Marmota monax]|uniref:Fibronectin type-III domain-containing protein n=1 Tax=Marmota monax TaxID=9995 RepID=A0A5E4AYZ7_MARMO|nr:hypothetical protein GHT09_003646 [Marmota monax]VTJ62693.1 Hypothetical predicted protein [Marmota monax]
MSEAVVTVTVVGTVTTTIASDTSERRTGDQSEEEVQPEFGRLTSTPSSLSSPWSLSSSSSSSSSSFSTSALSPASVASSSLSPVSIVSTTPGISASITRASRQSLQLRPDGKRKVKVEKWGSKLPPASANKKEELALLDQAMPLETNATIEDLRVVIETKESVTLTWNTINTTHSSGLTVLYSKYGEKDLLLLNADPSKNQVTLDGLEPGRQYVACVCPKGVPPQKDQCITFSTDNVDEGMASQTPTNSDYIYLDSFRSPPSHPCQS